VIRKALSLLLLLATGIGLYNVYADNSEVLMLAGRTACGSTGCVRTLRAERTPFAQTFTFQSRVQPPQTKAVRCERAYLLVGNVACALAEP
jgi:hypothetical protein